ncbi:MAG TPA: PEGA domain-containing protein [Anaeromyxobacter sp.]
MHARLRSLAVVLALCAGTARAAGPSLAVISLDAPSELSATGRSLAEAIAHKADGFQVTGPDAAEQKLGKSAYAALVRCGDDSECLAAKGKKLEVDRIVGGRLSKRGTSYRVALVHADGKTGARVGGVEREVAVASRRLQKDVVDATPALLQGSQEPTGVLRVVTEAPGAEVSVDGAVVGKTPVAHVVKQGRHQVKVALPGFVDAEAVWLEVPAGGIVEHRPRLYRVPGRDRPNASGSEGTGTAIQIVK